MLLVGLALLCGCESKDAPSAASPVLRGAPLTSAQLPTTHSRIWLANHDSRLAAVQSIVDEGAGTPAVNAELAGLYRTRFAVLNDFDDLRRAASAATSSLQTDAPKPDWLLTAADIAMKRHQFSEAEQLVARAESAGADSDRTQRLRIELDIARRQVESAHRSIRALADDRPSVERLARLGVLECERNLARAEHAFERAEALITDTNPYTVAWLHSLHGRCLIDRGEPLRAMTYLNESVRRLPELTSAQLFRAEALLAQDDKSAAIAIYRELAAKQQPEALAMLAVLTDGPARDEWTVRAQSAFAALRRDHPELAAAHLTGFVAQHTTPAQAIEILTGTAQR